MPLADIGQVPFSVYPMSGQWEIKLRGSDLNVK